MYLILGLNLEIEAYGVYSVCTLMCVCVCCRCMIIFCLWMVLLQLIYKQHYLIGFMQAKCLCELNIPKILRNIIESNPDISQVHVI